MKKNQWIPPTGLMDAMKTLALASGANRVEVQVPVDTFTPDGKTRLVGYYSVLYLPQLGWTAKNDFEAHTWADAYIVREDS